VFDAVYFILFYVIFLFDLYFSICLYSMSRTGLSHSLTRAMAVMLSLVEVEEKEVMWLLCLLRRIFQKQHENVSVAASGHSHINSFFRFIGLCLM